MYSGNKTNLKQQLEFLIKFWLEKQDNFEELSFFFHHEYHEEQTERFLSNEICKRIAQLKKESRKQEYTRQRYSRDGFYNSEAWKQESEKVKNMKDEDRYRVHPMRF